MSSQKGYSADWLAFIVLLIILASSLNANVQAASSSSSSRIVCLRGRAAAWSLGSAARTGEERNAEACCCLVTVKRNGQSNCVVPGLEESHQPRASAVTGHKDSTKNAALPRHVAQPEPSQNDRGKKTDGLAMEGYR
ncbi:uncharacterized [Tachysurus ichikawai]